MLPQPVSTPPPHAPIDDGRRELVPNLLRAIHHAGISVYYQDSNLRVLWAQNIPHSWPSTRVIGAVGDAELLPSGEAARLAEAKRRVLATGQSESCEIAVNDDKGVHWFNIWMDAEGGTGPGRGVLTTVVETTEHKRREQTLKSLLREVSHRSKNLLAIIQSIATQTGRYSGTMESFLSRFRGRLQSLAASQDLVTLSNWRGADLKELIANQVTRYSADPRAAIRFEGVNPYLNPNAALHIGLALHELAVNSMSYGALSQAGGFVTITARYDSDGEGQKVLRLNWQEAIPPSGEAPIEKKFGSVALERVVPASLRGSAQLDIGADRLNYALAVPAGTAGSE